MLFSSNFILLLIKTKRRKTLSCPHPPSTITVVQVLVKEVPEIKANNYHPSPRHHPYNSSLRSTNPGRVTNSHSQRFFIKSRKYWTLNFTHTLTNLGPSTACTVSRPRQTRLATPTNGFITGEQQNGNSPHVLIWDLSPLIDTKFVSKSASKSM